MPGAVFVPCDMCSQHASAPKADLVQQPSVKCYFDFALERGSIVKGCRLTSIVYVLPAAEIPYAMNTELHGLFDSSSRT